MQLTVVSCVAFFVLVVRGVNTMVDIVANKVFDAYSRLKPGNDLKGAEPNINYRKLRRFQDGTQMKKTQQRENEKVRDKYLYDIKENCVNVPVTNKRPLMGLSCYSCCPSSRDSLVTRTTQSLSLVNLFNQDSYINQNGIMHKICSDLLQVYSVKKFEYPRVEGTVLKDERLKKAIEKTAIEQFHDMKSDSDTIYKKLIKNNEDRAYKLLYDMRSTLSDFLLRFTSWVLYKLLPLFLNSVIVHPGQIEMLKKASNSGLPMIFIPLHRSHLDYIMVSFILLNRDIRSPLVAAGDNLRIPFFGSLLRGLGAFYIKRRIDPIMGRKDHVYKAVLHTYMNECLRAGHNIEFFLEGGRTRTGKPCMPKYGIFSVIVDAFMDGTIEDALLVPISMNYEKLIDGNFVREQLGEPKEMETFGLALSSIWKILNSNYGMMRIDFNQPFSLRELVKTFNTSNGKTAPTNGLKEKTVMRSRPSTTSLYGTDVVAEEHKQLVQSISNHVLYDCAASTAIMSTNAVAFLLLNKFRKGATLSQLTTALDTLRTELSRANKDVGFSGDSVDVIYYAVELLGPGLVRIENENGEETIKPVTMLPNVIELSYYSNCLMQHYVLKAILACALSMIDLQSGCVFEEELMVHCLELCDILQFEFILCKPCQTKESAIMDTIDDFVLNELILVQNTTGQENTRSKQMVEDLCGEDAIKQTPDYKINIKNQSVVERLQFLKDLLKPWLEPYCTSASCLRILVDNSMLENEITKEVLKAMKDFLVGSVVTYGESVCADPIKNSLKLFQTWDILECHAEDKIRLFYLKDHYDNDKTVRTVLTRIEKFKLAKF
ncbi:minotaur [Carabus blaptoides fortunei]